MNSQKIVENIHSGTYDKEVFEDIYTATFDAAAQHERYTALLKRHVELFGESDAQTPRLYSIPGRTELGGNHTDHNRGCVLAAAVNLDTIAAAVPTDDMVIVIDSEGFDPVVVDISNSSAEPDPQVYGTTDSLVTGLAAAFRKNGHTVGGFKANTSTSVLKGSGLSSSAAIEITIASILNDLYNDNELDPVTLAQYSQYSENIFFGKPSGLMDQTACAYGGIIGIDFKNPNQPVISEVSYSFNEQGYTLAVVDTGGNHADLTPAYAAIPEEMGSIAAHFGKSHCRDITFEQLVSVIPQLREKYGDRAVLRAIHFLQETDRAAEMVGVLKSGSFDEYLALVKASGDSSFKYLQNIYPSYHPEEQGLSLALALTEHFLNEDGACRVHGGGFAGTIQAYIPNQRIDAYRELMTSVFGPNAVVVLSIRNRSAGRII